MIRDKLIPAGAVLLVALSGVTTAVAGANKADDAKELTAARAAQITLAEAIATVESQTGGRVMRIAVERKDGAYAYKMKAVSQSSAIEVFVDPATGKIVRRESPGLIGTLFDKHDQDAFAKTSATASLAAAATAAETETGGTAFEAAFEEEDGSAVFEIEVAQDNAVQKVQIDATTGKVLKASTAEDH